MPPTIRGPADGFVLRLVRNHPPAETNRPAKRMPTALRLPRRFVEAIEERRFVMRFARKAAPFALVLAFLFIAVSSRAGEVSFPLKAEKDSPAGSGTAALADNKIRIQGEGLRPNGVYTVWFVNMKPNKHEAGAGTAPYMFRTDGQGTGSYESPLSESPFGKWSTIMVVRHPTGDPRDMKNMAPALSAGIPGKQ